MDHQPEATLLEFMRYNTWANRQVLAACASLGPDQLDAPVAGAYGTVRATLHHLLRAEAGYLKRINGTRPEPAFSWDDGPSLAELAAYAEQTGQAYLDTVQRVPPTHMVREEDDGQYIQYQARHLFMQVINHGLEHRTNITTYLSTLGLPVPEIDNWGYMFAHPARFETQEGSIAGG